jgi:predicted RNA-binding protein YlxR (DUF448 family)
LTEAPAEEEENGKRRAGRTRMCALTRSVLPERELIRFVAAPDGTVVADLKAKLPGRGVWIGATRSAVAEAVKRNVFPRALKAPVRPPAELADHVEARLRDAALGRLGLARKAGVAVAGFAKVEAAIATGRLAALAIAADAAEDGARKLRQALRRRYGEAVPVPVIRAFSAAELGLAMGRPDVIHAAALQGPAGDSFVEAATRLQRYLGADGGEAEERAAEPLGIGE